MEAVLSDVTALAYWRSHSESLGEVLIPRRMTPKRKGRPSIDAPSATTATDIASWGLADPEDIHLLVSSKASRRRVSGVTCTISSCEFPAHSFARTLGQVYVVSPELLFIQLAQQLSLAALLEVGYELCGTYRLGETPAYGMEPLTSTAAIKSYAQRAQGMRGQPAALQACQWLADGSGSPAETALSIMFRLPYRHGGYGLGKPLLNHEIKLNENAEHILGRKTMRPDFYWVEAKHPAEYDGRRYHSSDEQAEYDERRRNAYAAMNMNVTVLTTRHLYDLDLLDEMVKTIRTNTKIRQRRLPEGYDFKHRELYEETCSYWLELKRGNLSSAELAWRASRYDAPDEPW